jgi:hypothetical protein
VTTVSEGIGSNWTHCLPHLFRRPAFTLIVEIIFLNQPRVDPSRPSKAIGVIASEGTFVDRDRMKTPQECREHRLSQRRPRAAPQEADMRFFQALALATMPHLA